MPFIRYDKVDLSETHLQALHSDMKNATPERAYGRFKAWLHYANLKRWRGQGLHFWYMSGGNGDKYCTCGLVVCSEGREKAEKLEFPSIAELDIDEVHLYRGHRNLPSGRGITTALICSFEYREDLKDYLWNFFCQNCAETSFGKRLLEAKELVKEHNKRCKRSLAKR